MQAGIQLAIGQAVWKQYGTKSKIIRTTTKRITIIYVFFIKKFNGRFRTKCN